ncbi:hypothetical protein [Variovorax rhizosphaerae]|uniref:Uncharacterized protein n=1 Tax=Variovorax rhizosphaerae TaxID=1836200 RepID=A0ABU8WRG3_9BURK
MITAPGRGTVRTSALKPIVDAAWHHFVKVAELESALRAAQAADAVRARGGLTELGQQLHPRIKRLIAESESLADEVRASRGMPVGDVPLGPPPSTVPSSRVRSGHRHADRRWTAR